MVNFEGENSSDRQLVCGVPQGSCLGPLLFTLFVADLHGIAAHWEVGFHSYADDIQLFIHTQTCNPEAKLKDLVTCLHDINTWMSSNRLRFNPDKTHLVRYETTTS